MFLFLKRGYLAILYLFLFKEICFVADSPRWTGSLLNAISLQVRVSDLRVSWSLKQKSLRIL
jgi:hypothetical protein